MQFAENQLLKEASYGKDGKPVYEDENTVKTKTVETVRYRNTPSKFDKPKRREKTEIKAPKRKR